MAKMFDKGETFSGIPFELGLEAVDRVKAAIPKDINLVDLALKWILMKREVSCIIPGASKIEQVHSNIKASDIPDLQENLMNKIDEIYEALIKEHVHQLW
jgi:aryl-alcohol dehydrogenase-like predicted oxidoreductase